MRCLFHTLHCSSCLESSTDSSGIVSETPIHFSYDDITSCRACNSLYNFLVSIFRFTFPCVSDNCCFNFSHRLSKASVVIEMESKGSPAKIENPEVKLPSTCNTFYTLLKEVYSTGTNFSKCQYVMFIYILIKHGIK